MIAKAADAIVRGQSFLVASHESPDGDALASTLALVNALQEMGKQAVAFNRDGLPKDFEFLPGADRLVDTLPQDASFDVGFVLDAGELRRAGNHLRDCCRMLANIDHHPHSEQFGQVHFVDEGAASTGVLIYRLLRYLDHPISADVALCIYTSILADTGSFRYTNANPEAFRIAGEMIALGVNPWDVASGLYESQDAARLRLLAQALGTLQVSDCGRLASVAVTLEMMAIAGAGVEHTDGFVNYPRSVRGVEVALFFREIDQNSFKVGFRSKGDINVGALARELGGGGHHNAAGAVVQGSLSEVRQNVARLIQQLLP